LHCGRRYEGWITKELYFKPLSSGLESAFKMPPTLQRRVVGALIVIGAPVVFPISFLVVAISNPSQLAAVLIFVAIYLLVISGRIEDNSTRIGQLDWKGVPRDIVDLLTKTSTRGEYVNLRIIQVLDNSKVSESELHRLVSKRGVRLTLPAFGDYVEDVVSAKLISSPATSGTQAKQYSLTERGMACKKALGIVYPRSYYMFYLRNFLGVGRTPAIPPP